ncbi:hypothetical protein VTK73DRAFT_7318 [Phialemonium thermophilum]|uniref:t-SNARE coiled-coil homology domain-containing protein n=1 Tax=Phialemonium thermophilum TaxID=223376 RepID=A0ABR3XU42_9PEZI
MSNPNALFLLADHIKLSLLERQRAKTLNLGGDSQDGHISRSLTQLKDGLEAMEKERKRLEESGDQTKATVIADSLPSLQKQYNDLASQFHGFSTPTSSATLNSPNDPSLGPDFAHAVSTNRSSTDSTRSAARPPPPPKKSIPKTVRFSDVPSDLEAQNEDPSARELFGPYRDDPEASAAAQGYRDDGLAPVDGLSNVQIHAYHQRVLEEQDSQLDALGASISRQRELSMQIGDELDSQVAMLDETERLVDRHQGRLDRARRQVGRIARSAGESKQMIAIVVLIIILVLLIAVTK